MRDYSERRQKRANAPPKRPSTWPYVLLILILVLLAYLAGLATGWYLLRPGGRYYRAPLTAIPTAPQKKDAALPPQGEPIAPVHSPQSSQQPQTIVQNPSPVPPANVKGDGAPPLTFYNTLQRGNKGLIGTGINQPKEGPQPAPQPAAPPQTVPPQAVNPKPIER